jgi:periplasmic copper chaperone A
MRFRPAYLVAAVAVVLGLAGLVRGATSTGTPAGIAGAPTPTSTRPPGVTAGDITVSGAYVREPADPQVAAAYLSITNSGSQPDVLESVSTGAAKRAELHDVPGAGPGSATGQAGGEHQATGPLTIPPGATVTLSPGKGHVMLENPTGRLRPGDRVSLVLTFDVAGQILVEAPVVAIADPGPTSGGTG